MDRIERTGEGPNIAGVSLAFYLFFALLSLMASYDAGKPSDDLRNSFVVHLQSNGGPQGKSGDDGDDLFAVLAFEPSSFFLRPCAEQACERPIPRIQLSRSFDARGPPAFTPPAA